MTASASRTTSADIIKTFGSFARLVKYRFVLDFFLALVIMWTALEPASRFSGDILLTLLFFGLGQAGVLFAVMTLDDVTGSKDGSDSANYQDASKTQSRPLKRKPLLTGELTVRQAQRFGYFSLAFGALWWTIAIVHTPHKSLWAILITVLLLTLSVQYSWGLKLSYRGLGELLLLFSASAFVLAPYGLTTGTLPALVLTEGLLFGFGQLLIAGYSNTNDISGDAAVGRRTIAVLTSAHGNKIFLGILTAANLLVIVVPVAAGWIPWWFIVTAAPLIVLRLRQYRSFMHDGHALLARSRGMVTFRTTVACVLLFNIIHFGF